MSKNVLSNEKTGKQLLADAIAKANICRKGQGK